jgi:hypothetical protein
MWKEGRRIMLFAASNNKHHFKSIGKFTGDYTIFLSCFAVTELIIGLIPMITVAEPSLSIDLKLQRASKVVIYCQKLCFKEVSNKQKRQSLS